MRHSKLAQIRKSRGITQQQMAEHLGYSDKSGYCQLENGKISLTVDKAIRISEILDVDVKEIFFDREVEENTTIDGETA